ncbi:MAG: tetratricopeptide repeat protein [Ignavibacteria bacterium]|nr:tetratricopeptide repeat protein [Ignavibacteria bacterium]
MKNLDIQVKIDVSAELLNEARTFYESSNYDESERCANEVLALLEPYAERDDLGNEREESSQKYAIIGQLAHAYNRLNIISMSRGDYALSQSQADTAIRLCERIGNIGRKADLLGNIGIVYHHLSDYTKALEYYHSVLAINEEIGSKNGIASILGNIGLVYKNLSDYTKALEYLHKVLAINEEIGNKKAIAANLGNIGGVYQFLSDYTKALEYYHKSLAIYEENGSKNGIAVNLGNIGGVYQYLSDYTKALEYLKKSLAINEEIGSKNGIANNLANIGLVYGYLSDYTKTLEYLHKALAIYEDIGSKNGIARNLGNIGSLYALKKYEGYDTIIAEQFLLKAVAISTEIGAKDLLAVQYKYLADLFEHEKRWEEFAVHYKKYIEIEKEINLEEVKKQESIREQQKVIEIERTRTTAEKNILSNILPEEITQRLIKGENPIADHFDSVSVLFMDIVDFTPLATSITAQQLVHLLNAIFKTADGVMRECGLEKIKTIGDAYMAVAGAPTPCDDHALRAATAAIKLLEVMQNLVVTFPDSYGDRSWIESIPEIQVRIGLHCGPVAAGVVGENKFLYDLWGDAVNTASRMESHGEAGKIHVSEEFLKKLLMVNGEWLIDDAHDFSSLTINNLPLTINHLPLTIIPRGEIDIKGKGMMKTYFLEIIKDKI